MDYDYDLIASGIKMGYYSKLGQGSSRRVYDIHDGYVVKVAMNDKGYDQNQVEYSIYNDDEEAYFAQIYDCCPNFRYLIMAKAERSIKSKKQLHMILGYDTLDLLSEKILAIAVNYKLVFSDLLRISSWGMVQGKPKIIDYGLSENVYATHYGFKAALKKSKRGG